MKTLSIAFAVAVCANVATAQDATLVNGQKALVKNGRTVTQSSVQLPGAPLVGGADLCGTPDVIVGTGPHAYDNTAASTGAEGQTQALCLAFGTMGIENDVWFTWVAPSTATVTLSVCGMGGNDTKVAIYNGTSCPTGAAVACNDDFCALQTQLTFPATGGNSYVIQFGSFPGGSTGVGTFTVGPPPPPPANDDCSTPTALAGPGTYAFNTAGASTSSQQSGSCPAANRDLWYSYTATTNGSATATTCGLTTGDSVLAVYNGPACPTTGSLACNDDFCGLQTSITWTTVCGQSYLLQVGAFGTTVTYSGSFNITETGTPCGPASTPYCFGNGTGTACPCGNNGAAGNGCANSVNANGGNLATSGNASVSADTLVLLGTGMPNASALYFQGSAQVNGGNGVAFGDGKRCAGGTIVRLGTKLNVLGASQYPTGGDLAIHIKGNDVAGDVRNYQCWYRNADVTFCPPATFNLTNGVNLTWAP